MTEERPDAGQSSPTAQEGIKNGDDTQFTVYVGNLSPQANEQELGALFTCLAPLTLPTNVKVMRDKTTGMHKPRQSNATCRMRCAALPYGLAIKRSRHCCAGMTAGFGFVTFADRAAAEHALEALNGQVPPALATVHRRNADALACRASGGPLLCWDGQPVKLQLSLGAVGYCNWAVIGRLSVKLPRLTSTPLA